MSTDDDGSTTNLAATEPAGPGAAARELPPGRMLAGERYAIGAGVVKTWGQ